MIIRRWLVREAIVWVVGAVILLVLLAALGCQPFEMSARDSIVAAGGFIRKAQMNHLDECLAFTRDGTDLGKSAVIFPAITKAIAAYNLAVDLLNVYCASPDYDLQGGKCVPNKELQPKVEAALRELTVIVAEVKAVIR